jgi:hypothetical protein
MQAAGRPGWSGFFYLKGFSMSRPVFALLLLSPLLACQDPIRDECMCTLKACFEGVTISLAGNPDSTRYRDFSVALAYGDTVEAASADWPSFDPGAYAFNSSRLRRQRPAHIEVRIGYTKDGAAKQLALDTSLAWSGFVCNHCSGNSGSCTDQISHSAAMDVGLASRL